MERSRALLRSAATLLCGSLLALAATADDDGPEQVYSGSQVAIAEERWGAVYDGLSRRAQQSFEDAMVHVAQHMAMLGITDRRSARDWFIRVVPKTAQLRALFEVKEYSVSSVDRKDGEAVLHVVEKGKAESRAIRMVEEDRLWKLDVGL